MITVKFGSKAFLLLSSVLRMWCNMTQPCWQVTKLIVYFSPLLNCFWLNFYWCSNPKEFIIPEVACAVMKIEEELDRGRAWSKPSLVPRPSPRANEKSKRRKAGRGLGTRLVQTFEAEILHRCAHSTVECAHLLTLTYSWNFVKNNNHDCGPYYVWTKSLDEGSKPTTFCR